MVMMMMMIRVVDPAEAEEGEGTSPQ